MASAINSDVSVVQSQLEDTHPKSLVISGFNIIDEYEPKETVEIPWHLWHVGEHDQDELREKKEAQDALLNQSLFDDDPVPEPRGEVDQMLLIAQMARRYLK